MCKHYCIPAWRSILLISVSNKRSAGPSRSKLLYIIRNTLGSCALKQAYHLIRGVRQACRVTLFPGTKKCLIKGKLWWVRLVNYDTLVSFFFAKLVALLYTDLNVEMLDMEMFSEKLQRMKIYHLAVSARRAQYIAKQNFKSLVGLKTFNIFICFKLWLLINKY